MLEVVDHVNESARLIVDVKVAHGPRARGHGLDCFRREVNAEDVVFAFDSGLEIDCTTALGPSELCGNEIKVLGGKRRMSAARARRERDYRVIAFVTLSRARNAPSFGRPT